MKNKYKAIIFLLALFFSTAYPGLAQKQMLLGKIINEKGNPVPNAIVSVIENGGEEVKSDSIGNFLIDWQIGQQLEIVSGNRSKTYTAETNQATFTITDEDALIPIGFGMNRNKNELTSAIGVVRSNKLSENLVINPANALFGKIPGLSVLENGGTSWENNPSLFIRGIGTFNDPSILVLVDGFERPISSLSLGEIESVAILKDAAALSIYGLRGANGVLMVTTKRADVQKNNFEVKYEHGITKAFRLPKFLNSHDYANSINQASLNDGLSPIYSQSDLDNYKSGNSPFLYPDMSWVDESFRKFGKAKNLEIAFQGIDKTISHYTHLNFHTEEGLLGPVNENDGYSTQLLYGGLNFRSNLDINITKSTKFKINIGGSLRKINSPSSSISSIMNAVYNTPSNAYPVKTNNNNWGGTSLYNNNPIAQIAATGYSSDHIRELLVDFTLEQKLDNILTGLSVELALAHDNLALYNEKKTRQFQYEELEIATNGESIENLYGQDTELAYQSRLQNQRTNTTARGQLNYTKNWKKNSLISTLIYQQDKIVRVGRNNTFLYQLFAGNIHYQHDMKYFADISASYSGMNFLPKNNRFGFFPAISFAWKLSEEDWFAKNGIFDDFKIRASMGKTGNALGITQNLDVTKFSGGTGYYFTSNNTYLGGMAEGRYASNELSYETSFKYNLGADFSMFNKLEMNVDVFSDQRSNILIVPENAISDILGTLKPYKNAGIINNKGVELGVNFYNNIGQFTYYVLGQFSYVKNKIIEMGEIYRPYDYLKRTGQSIGQPFGLEDNGFFKDLNDISNSSSQTFSEVSPGDIKYKDQNGDNIIDLYDEKPLGFSNINPEIYYSTSLGMEYKGFGFKVLFQGIAKYSIYLNTASLFWPLRGNTSISEFSNNSWTAATAETASLPRLSTLDNSNNYRPNSIWIIDGSYLKLRSVEISYKLPEQFISKLNLSSTRLFLKGTDLFSHDNLGFVDPEAIGITYPTRSTYSVGIQIEF